MATPDSGDMFQIFHSIWSAVLTLLGGLILWNLKSMKSDIDSKAQKDEVSQLREDIADWKKEQWDMHRDNTRRLDKVLDHLARISPGSDA